MTGGNAAPGSGQPQPAPRRRRKRLPRAWILRSGATFRFLREKGRRIHGPHHTLTVSIPVAVPAVANVSAVTAAPAPGSVATSATPPGASSPPAKASKAPRRKKAGPTKELVAFSTSRRVGNAVVRNRVRRVMREVHRLHLARPLQDRVLLWSAKHSAAKLSFAEMKVAMEILWKRVTRWS